MRLFAATLLTIWMGSNPLRGADPSILPGLATASLPTLSITDATVFEGSGISTNAVLSVRLSAPSTQIVSITYSTVYDGTAQGSDFVFTNGGLLIFPPGVLTNFVVVPVLNDDLFEPDESFFVELSNSTNALIADAQGVVTILNDDPIPVLTISDVSVVESDVEFPPNSIFEARTNFVGFTVSLSGGSDFQMSFRYVTRDGTATAGSDYVAITNSVVFPPGTANRSATMLVKVLTDTIPEPLESFELDLFNPAGLILSRNRAKATIVDDDGFAIPKPTVSFTSSGPIQIPAASLATPYPSSIVVSGLGNATIKTMTVTLSNLTHNPYWTDALLVGPSGRAVMLMSDAAWRLTNVSLVFSDGAADRLPLSVSVNSGEYRPTDYRTGNLIVDIFAPPAPSSGWTTNLSGFYDTNPNGVWQLFVTNASDSFAGVVAGGWSLNFELRQVVTLSDSFAARSPLAGPKLELDTSNVGATKESGEPAHSGNPGGASVWFSWTAPASGRVRIETTGSAISTLLSAYVGDALARLSLVASNTVGSLLAFNAVSNTTYQIAIDAVGGSTGRILISLKQDAGQFLIAQDPRQDFWVTDGRVHAAVETNGTLYIGGDFNVVRPNREKGILLDVDTLEAKAPLPAVIGQVFVAIADGLGGWYIGGAFTSVGGVPRTNLAHVLPDKSIDPAWCPSATGLFPAISSAVFALALADQWLYVGGSFAKVNGEHHYGLARVDATTGSVDPWWASAWYAFDPGPDPPPTAPPPHNDPGVVTGLLVAKETLYVRGGFTQFLGLGPRTNLAAFNARTGVILPWNPNTGPGGIFNSIFAMDTTCDTLYVGGYFLEMGGLSARSMAAFDLATGAIKNWRPAIGNATPQVPGRVYAIAATDDVVYVGGTFRSVLGKPRDHIAALDSLVGQPTSWNPGADDRVVSLLKVGKTVFAGGQFNLIGGQTRPGWAALNADTGGVLPWQIESSGAVEVMGISSRALYAPEAVSSAGGLPRQNLAAFDLATGQVTPWNPGANGPVNKLALSENVLYAIGTFTNIGGQSRNHLGAVELATGLATSWQADYPASIGDLHPELAVAGDLIYAGHSRQFGAFDRVTGQRQWGAELIGPFPDPDLTFAIVDDTLYAGGEFETISGVPRKYLAAFDRVTGTLKNWNPKVVPYCCGLYNFPFIRRIIASGHSIFIDGDFVEIDGQPRWGLAAVDARTGMVTPWNPYRYGVWLSDLRITGGDVFGPQLSVDDVIGKPSGWRIASVVFRK